MPAFADAAGSRHSPPPKPTVTRPVAESPRRSRGSSLPLLGQQFLSALRGFVHQEPHFGMLRLEIRHKALVSQFLGGHGADRADHDARERAAKFPLAVHFSRHSQQMGYLN